jgi:hypothetical protein
MEKKYIIGGLAIVGAVALFAYLKPKMAKKNSEGFFNATGKLTRCRRPDGTYYTTNGKCINYAVPV